MYLEKLPERGRPAERTRNLQDLLRLTLAAVEIVGARREALDSVVPPLAPEVGIPTSYRHAVYETSVVFEFSQLARQDFQAHQNVAVWERPLVWQVPEGTYDRSGHIDMALFSARRDVETRIEFGKADPRLRSRPQPRDLKLEDDARKLRDARDSRRWSKDDSTTGLRDVENFVVIWEERDTRVQGQKTTARLNGRLADAWSARCKDHAAAATTQVGCTVTLEATAASTLMSFEAKVHRSAYAAIYSVEPGTSPISTAVAVAVVSR